MSDTSKISDMLIIPGRSSSESMDFAQFYSTAIVGLFCILVFGALFAPAFPFTSDSYVHAEMARAFAESGAFHIADNNGVAGAPALQPISTHALGDIAYPQYPSGYGVVAAPFYAAFGLRGLVILNAISGGLVLALAYRLASKLYNRNIAALSVFILAGATYFFNYAFGIWPHMFSVFLWLAIVVLTLDAHYDDRWRARIIRITAAGLITGFGAAIRVDVILAAPVVYLWLRLFARPHDRITPLTFLVSLAPGLIAAASMNAAKFGLFSPFYYGPNPGPDSLSRYLWLVPLLAVTGLGSLVINIPKTVNDVYQRFDIKHLLIAAGVVITVIFILGFSFISNYLYSIYVLVVDLQLYNGYYVQTGVERNEYGSLLFWGFPKRALLQSLPFATLLIIPVVEIFRGQRLMAHSLCALCICAPICFYGLNQWHGGGSYNMRYFLPAVPFIAILSAYALSSIVKHLENINRTHILALSVVAAALFVSFEIIRTQYAPSLFALLALYPQLLLSCLLALSIVAFLTLKKNRQKLAQTTFFISILAITYAGMLNFSDEISNEKARAQQRDMAKMFARDIPNDALVLSGHSSTMMYAKHNGVSALYTTEKNGALAAKAALSFQAENRCVFFQHSMISDLVKPFLPANSIHPEPIFIAEHRFPDDPRLTLYMLTSQRDQCAF